MATEQREEEGRHYFMQLYHSANTTKEHYIFMVSHSKGQHHNSQINLQILAQTNYYIMNSSVCMHIN